MRQKAKPAVFSAIRRDWVLEAESVLANIGKGEFLPGRCACAGSFFAAKTKTLDPVGGHIPGARNRFFRDNLAADGRFKPAVELRKEWLKVPGRCAFRVVGHVLRIGAFQPVTNLLALSLAGLDGGPSVCRLLERVVQQSGPAGPD